MKKCKNKTRKRKLPKYDLGTMKPRDLGYQKARGIDGFHAKVDQGLDISGETQAIEESILSNALNTTLNYGTQVANNLKEGPVFGKSVKSSPSMTSTINNATLTMNRIGFNNVPLWQIKAGVNPSNLAPSFTGTTINTATSFAPELGTEIGSSLGGNLSSTGLAGLGETSADTFFGTAAKEGAKSGGKLLGNIANIGGKALSVIAAAKGLYDMGSQIANAGDHRSAQDMATTSGRQYYTTDRGNSYMNYSGVNAAREMAYEKAMKNAKQTNFFLTSTGTGATIGSLFPGWGTAIGAGVGALVGGIGSLLGLGDNEDEVKDLIRRTNDNFANFNRQGESSAKSKDIAAEFYAGAKEGKGAYGPMKYKKGKEDVDVLQGPNGYAIGKPTSLLAPGEYTYDPVNMTGSKVTGKGHEDTEPSYIEPNDLNIVFSDHLKIGNKSIAKHAAPLIKETEWLNRLIHKASIGKGMRGAQQQLQIQQALQRQQQLNEQLVQLSELQNVKRAEKEMGSYKCGKKPGYDDGKGKSKDSLAPSWFDYGLASLPHLASLVSSNDSYHRAKHASTYAPSTYVDNAAGRRAINELAQLRFDPSQYLNDALRAYNQANWQVNRNAGYGAGAQAIMRNANLQSYLNSLGQIRIAEQDANNKYRAAYADALSKYGAAEQEAMIRDNIQRFNWQQQQNAAKEYYMDTYRKNRLTAIADAVHDVMGVKQFDRSLNYQDRMLDLYGRQMNLEEQKLANQIAQQAEANRAAYNQSRQQSQSATSSVYNNPTFQLSTQTPLERTMAQLMPMPKLNSDTTVADNIARKLGIIPKYSYKCGKPGYLLGTEGLDGLVDTRSDTTTQGYHEGAIPVGAGYGPAAQGPMELMTLLTESPATLNNPYLLTGEAPTPSRDWAKINEILRARKAATIAKTKKPRIPSEPYRSKEGLTWMEEKALISAARKLRVEKNKALIKANREASKIKNKKATIYGRPTAYGYRTYNTNALTANDFE